VAAQEGRLWHVLVFSVMAILGTAHQVCDAGGQLHLGGSPVCSHSLRESVGFFSTIWAYFCFIQVCLVVLGPEDPWLHRSKGTGLAMRIGDVPIDVLLFARALPLLALFMNFAMRDEVRSSDGSSEDAWYTGWAGGSLLTNGLLFLGCAAWWLGCTPRRAQAMDILLRVRFWKRFGLLLVLPGLLLFPIALASEVLRWKVLQAARHAGCSAIAAAALGEVFRGKVDLSDRALQNWLIVPWVLLGSSMCFFATLVGVFTVDALMCRAQSSECSQDQWLTLSDAAALPGGHFVLALMMPLLVCATAATVWVIDASPVLRSPITDSTGGWSPWDRALPFRLPCAPLKLRGVCRWLGCRFLYAAMALGAATGLCLKHGPLHNVLHVAIVVPFFGSLWLAVILCTASTENSTLFGLLRFVVTVAIAKGMLVLLCFFVFLNHYLHNLPDLHPSLYPTAEYFVLYMLAMWPLTWIEDARAVRDPSVGAANTGSSSEGASARPQRMRSRPRWPPSGPAAEVVRRGQTQTITV